MEILDDAILASGASGGTLRLHVPDFGVPEPMEVVVASGRSVDPEPIGDVWTIPVRLEARVVGRLEVIVPPAARTSTRHERLECLAALAALIVERAEAQQRSERRRRWTEATHHLLEVVAPPIEPRAALTQVARLARSVAGSAAAFVVAADAEVIAADGPEAHAWNGAQLAALVSAADGQLSPRLADPPGGSATISVLPTHLVRQCDLVLIFAPGDGPDGQELAELSSFAHFAALLLDRVKGLEYDAEMALLAERNRIATGLHDGVIQQLFSVGLELETSRIAADGTAPAARFTRAIDAVDKAIASLRETIEALGEASDPSAEHVPTPGP